MGKLIILGGPSCSGKTSIKNKLISMFFIRFKKLVTCTTRHPRVEEVGGKDYFFLTEYEFEEKIFTNEIIEHREYAGMKYGVLRKTIDDIKNHHSYIVAVMDLSGIKKMEEYLGKENVISIYIDISKETMMKRLKERGSTKEEIQERINKAINEEMTQEYKENFDLIIKNENKNIDITLLEILDFLRESGDKSGKSVENI